VATLHQSALAELHCSVASTVQYPVNAIPDVLSLGGHPNWNRFTGQQDVNRLRGHPLILPPEGVFCHKKLAYHGCSIWEALDMGKKLKRLAARVTALEQAISQILSGKTSTRKKTKKKKAKKVIAKKLIRAKIRPSTKARSEKISVTEANAPKTVHIPRKTSAAVIEPVVPITKPQSVKPLAAPAPKRPTPLPTLGGRRNLPIHNTGH
jgi:hypothetical protein